MLNNRTQTIQSITSTQSACCKSNNVRWLLCALLVTVYGLISFVTLESQIQEYNKMMEINIPVHIYTLYIYMYIYVFLFYISQFRGLYAKYKPAKEVIYKRLLENVIFYNAKLASLYNAYWLMNTVTYHKVHANLPLSLHNIAHGHWANLKLAGL